MAVRWLRQTQASWALMFCWPVSTPLDVTKIIFDWCDLCFESGFTLILVLKQSLKLPPTILYQQGISVEDGIKVVGYTILYPVILVGLSGWWRLFKRITFLHQHATYCTVDNYSSLKYAKKNFSRETLIWNSYDTDKLYLPTQKHSKS